MRSLRLFSGLSVTLLACAAMPAQAINVTANAIAADLASALLVPSTGLTVVGSSLQWGVGGENPFPQSGTYSNLQGTYGLPGPGIVLSSGNVNDYNTMTPPLTDPVDQFNGTGSGNSSGSGSPATGAQEGLLNPITGQSQHFDPVQLDVEFTASTSSNVTFFATFGSEEWPEYVGAFQDGFGLYVNGTNVAGAQQTGTTNPPVLPQPINIDHPDMQLIPGTELDGILAPNGSPVLRFEVPINAGLNTLTAILADANDSALDTTVYLSALQGDETSSVGDTEFTPILPSGPPGPIGEIIIELASDEIPDGTFYIDPDVVIGYDVDILGGEFLSTTMPSLATIPDIDGYLITYLDEFLAEQTVALGAGQFFAFPAPVSSFLVSDIDPTLLLDPDDVMAFPLGVDVGDSVSPSGITITMTPQTVFVGSVPEPGTLAALAVAALGLAGVRRRNRR